MKFTIDVLAIGSSYVSKFLAPIMLPLADEITTTLKPRPTAPVSIPLTFIVVLLGNPGSPFPYEAIMISS